MLKSPFPWLVVIDGLDKVGKTTIRNMLLKKLGRTHDVIDRWLLSDIAYNYIYDRMPENWYDKEIEWLKLNSRHLIIYIKPDLSNKDLLPKLDKNDEIERDYKAKRKAFEEGFEYAYNYLLKKGVNIVVIENDYVTSLETLTDKILIELIERERNI